MNICLYGASSSAIEQSYITATEELGRTIAAHGHGLVYGGGAMGLMGAAARGTVSGGGNVIGVAPSFFNVDGALFAECTEFIHTKTMRERKQLMEERSDAFIMVPGGPGTLDEFFEILTLKQLGRHSKPIAVFNINGYFDGLEKFLEGAVEKRFVSGGCLRLFSFFDNAEKAVKYLESCKNETADVAELKGLGSPHG